MINQLNICTKIRKLRQSKEMNQQEFADLLGITRGHLSNIEKGTRGVTIDLLLIIHQHFNITPNEMLDIGDKPDIKNFSQEEIKKALQILESLRV